MTTVALRTPVELAEEIFRRLNDRDVEALLPFAAPALVEEWPIVGRLEGVTAVAAHFASIFASIPDAKIEVEQMMGNGETVFVHWHMRGTFTGAPFNGLLATGRPIDIKGTDYFKFHDGKVVSNFVAYDGFAFAVQAGLLPASGSVADHAVTALTNLRTKLTRALRH